METTSSSSPFETVDKYEFINLTTYRRDGTPVPTPVWFARDGGSIYVQTMPNAGKIKRIRATGRVTFGPSDARGNMLGPLVEGAAVVLDQHDTKRAEDALQAKYGERRTQLMGMMGGGHRAYIEIRPVAR